ncbi:MAG: DPP IV N-terminal domain-containing protein [Odoribacter sp.]
MNKKILLIFILFILGIKMEAQPIQKANYPLAEKFRDVGLGSLFARNSMTIHPRFINGTDKFWFDFRSGDGTASYFVDPEKRLQEPLFNAEALTAALSEYTREVVNSKDFRMSDPQFSKDFSKITFYFKDQEYVYNRKTEAVKRLPLKTEKENGEIMYSYLTFSPDKRYVLYARDHNLYVRGAKNKGTDTTEIQLTNDGERYYSYAKDEDAENSGKNTASSARWCPDSRHIYIVRGDCRKVKDMYVLNSLSTPRPKIETYRYEMPADQELCQYELWITDLDSRKVRKIEAQKWKDQYISVVESSKKGDRIYFERFKRTWDETDLCVVNTTTGEMRELIHEVDKPYRDVHLKNVLILNDGKDILYRSERTGWGHYYHYDGNGKLKNAITSGPWTTGSIISVDSLKREIYFYGFGREKEYDPYYYILYKAHIDREGVTLLSKENAQHTITLSPSHQYYTDVYSRVNLAPRIQLRNQKGKILLELAHPDTSILTTMGWRAPERFCVKAADGVTDLYGVMWKPADFDPKKKYPIISSVYPGPYFEYVQTTFSPDERYNMKLAQVGFIVIAVGHRGGSPMRGKAYHRFGYGNMRDYPLADDKYAIEQLADRYDYIDLSRIGIFGHSGGGFMATAAICTYPDFYKVAVSSSGNHDNNIYNRGWVEIYNGVTENAKTVKTTSGNDSIVYTYTSRVATNIELAKRLKGHLLLVSGDMDRNVHPAHLLRMADALIRAGKNFEMVILPGEKHGYTGEANTFFEKKLWFHFSRYLLGDDSANHCTDMKTATSSNSK